jgi:hypothetical protein
MQPAPVSIKWQDMQATIHKPLQKETLANDDSNNDIEGALDLSTEDQMMVDGLHWLDGDLPVDFLEFLRHGLNRITKVIVFS